MYKFSIVTNIGVLGKTEDGGPYRGEILSIMAETKDGSRFSHITEFPCASTGIDDDDGSYFVEIDIFGACKRAETLLDEIEDCIIPSELDPEYWTEVSPVFGSPAYQSMNIAAIEDI